VSSSNLRTLPYSKIDSGKLYPFNQKLRFEPEVERFGA